MYDEKEVKKSVSKRKKLFIAYLIIALITLQSGALLLAFNINDGLFFLGITLILLPLIFIFNIFSSFSPNVLFSRAVKGKNIKEHVYEVYVRRGVALRPKQVGMPYGGQPLSHTRMAKASLRSAVYLKLDNGNIKEIRGMRVEHVELFEDGDVLYKPAGAKYPVIISRPAERQPCPLCGTINPTSITACISCGLKMKNE